MLKKLLVLAGLAGIAALVAKKLLAGSDEQPWPSSYAPQHGQATPVPDPATQTPAESDDAGGSTPDEVLADSTDEPHQATTPDAPAAVTEVTEQPDPERL